MDIAYLLFLQDFRIAIGDALTPLMSWLSHFAVRELLFIPVFIYWCMDKKAGLRVIFATRLCVGINAVIKLCACVYRPWIRDPRIVPANNAIQSAGGYSFPSGHTTTATPLYGGLASWQWNRHRALSWLCVVMLLLTGFSRNYLGVHTPQDVLVGLLLGVCCLWTVTRLSAYFEANPGKEDLYLVWGFVLSVLALVYVNYKSYPLDYVDGRLLVDPQKMLNDAYGDIGGLIAFFAARFVEKHWIRFRAPGTSAKAVTVCLLGLVPLLFIVNNLKSPMVAQFGPHWGNLIAKSIRDAYIVAGFPAVLALIFGREDDAGRS